MLRRRMYDLCNHTFIIQEQIFLDVRQLPVLPKKVLDIPYRGPYESRRLWSNVTQAIRKPEGPDWKTVEENKTKLGRY